MIHAGVRLLDSEQTNERNKMDKSLLFSEEVHKMLEELKGTIFGGVELTTKKSVLETAIRKFYNEIKESEAKK